MMIEPTLRRALARALTATVVMAALVGCASPPYRAPVEDRGPRGAPSGALTPDASKPPPGAENAGKPGYYAVKPGDTMLRIGLETGQNWRDIVRWNNLDNPNVLEVGQVLRVVPPSVDAAATTARAVPPTRVEARPLDGTKPVPAAGAASATVPATAPVAPAAVATGASGAPTSASTAAVARAADDEIAWAWPTASSVTIPFDDARTKGLVFAGKAGDPVLAAADGRVVYAGSGLRGYGNLVIVKHNNTYLTAYAHNQTLLVKEDQVVRRGQKIAEMGSSDAERVQLHFELRKLGKPIDPARLLPPR
jgi:lipoprotein NlpD